MEPTNFYDVVSFSDKVTDFIVIGEEDTGGALLINLVNGTLWLLAHDYPAADKSWRVGENSSFFPVAGDFRQFRRILLSEEESRDLDTFGIDWKKEAEFRRQKNLQIQEEHLQRKLRKKHETK